MLWRTLGSCALLSLAVAPGASPECKWDWGWPQPTGNTLTAVASGAGRWVAVGEHGTVLTSQDTVTWVAAASGTSEHLRAVRHHAGRFVAVGDNGTILTSADGVAWSARQVPGLWHHLLALGSDGQGLVAVGEVVVSSPDGLGWTLRHDGYSARQAARTDVVWGNGRWIAGGERTAALVSTDGASWSVPQPPPWSVRPLAFANGVFVGWHEGALSYSSDGLSWTATVGAEGALGGQVVFDGSSFVLVDVHGDVYTSEDGRTWLGGPPLTTTSLRALGAGQGRLVAVGARATVLVREADGSWVRRGLSRPSLLRVAVDDTTTTAVAVGENGAVTTLRPGPAWTAQTVGNVTFHDVEAASGRFVAVGEGGAIQTSTDGLAWAPAPSGVSSRLRGMGKGPGGFMVVGDGGVMLRSADGLSWSEGSGTGGESLDVAFGAGLWVAVGLGGQVRASQDGVAWQEVQPATLDGELDRVRWDGERFVATGSAWDCGGIGCGLFPSVALSRDGLHWRVVPYTFATFGSRNGQLLGLADVPVASLDGETGLRLASGASLEDAGIQALAPYADGWLAVGFDGAALHIPCLEGPLATTPDWVVQGVGHTAGVGGTSWVSDLTLHNPGDLPAQAAVWFWPNGTVNRRTHARLVAVAAGASVIARDVVAAWFGSSGSGTLGVTADREVLVAARTYNDAATGSFGHAAVVRRMFWTDPPRDWYTPMLGGGPSFRTNLGFANPFDHALTHGAELFRSDGASLGRVGTPLRSFESALAVDALAGAANANSYIHSILSYAEPLFAAVVDNRTGDAMAIAPATAATGPLVVPTGAHLPGLGGTRWRTDLEVVNPALVTTHFTVALLPRDRANSAPDGRSFQLEPGRSVRFRDVLHDVFGCDGAAALRITSDLPVVAGSRTYNDAAGGTFGDYVPAIPVSRAVPFGQRAWLLQLAQRGGSRGTRTNLGLVNTSGTPITVTARFFRPDGSPIGSTSHKLPPHGFRQIDQVLAGLGTGDVEGAHAVLETVTPGGAFLAYASVVDGRTGDPTVVTAVRWSPDGPTGSPGLRAEAKRNGTLCRLRSNVPSPTRTSRNPRQDSRYRSASGE